MTTGDLGFRHATRRNGDVVVTRGGRLVATLRGATAARFLAEAEDADPVVVQRRLARLTGNYRRSNERGGRRR